jgi:hypothetical protein
MRPHEFANVAGRSQNFIPGRCYRHPTHPDRKHSTNMKNYDSLTAARILWTPGGGRSRGRGLEQTNFQHGRTK